jgi:hypothetical protein
MVRLANPENYEHLGFEKNRGKKYKYDAILKNKKTGELRRISFGDKNYQQYHDSIGEYSQLDHKDEKRRQLYRKRHKGEDKYKYSSGYFALRYLW